MKRIFFAFFLLSCLGGIIYAKPIGLESATLVAKAKLLQMDKSDGFSIAGAVELRDDSGIILAYVFNLNPQGYVAVSANTDIPPVIAYSFTSSSHDENMHDNVLFEMLKTDIQLRIDNIDNLPEYIINNRNTEWQNISDDKAIEITDSTWPPVGSTTTGGWIETTWNQNAPYNALCPMDPVTHLRSLTGCPSTAMAQILNYHRTTNHTYFDDSNDYYHNYAGRQYWIDNDHGLHDFPSFPELNVYLDTLTYHYEYDIVITSTDMAALTFACGVAATQVYTSEGCGTFGVSQAYDAYMKFNCEDAELLDESDVDLYDRLSQNIRNALPVHLAVVTPAWDAGHNLVVDGYNTDNYYHLNFGWGGTYDGWYLLPDEIPFELTVIEGVIVDIMYDTTDIRDVFRSKSYGIKSYPNPFNSSCCISAAYRAKIEIYDISGKCVMAFHEVPSIWQPDESIGNGIYFLRAIMKNGKTETRRIIYLK